jgi:nitrate reductase NapE component
MKFGKFEIESFTLLGLIGLVVWGLVMIFGKG